MVHIRSSCSFKTCGQHFTSASSCKSSESAWYLHQDLSLQGLRWWQPAWRVSLDAAQVEFVPKDLSQVLCHLLLLRNPTVVLYGQDDGVPVRQSDTLLLRSSQIQSQILTILITLTNQWNDELRSWSCSVKAPTCHIHVDVDVAVKLHLSAPLIRDTLKLSFFYYSQP